MRIIALRGDSNQGKTATLNLVYNRILDPLNRGVSTCKKQEGGDKRDFSDIVNYKGQKVAFFSMADATKPLVSAIRNYDSLGIDILVCANNINKTNQLKEINKFINDILLKTIAAPSNSANDLIANTTDANTIFGLI